MSLFLSINWACNLLIGFLTLTAIDGLGGVQSSMDDDEKSTAEKKGAIIELIYCDCHLVYVLKMVIMLPLIRCRMCVPHLRGFHFAFPHIHDSVRAGDQRFVSCLMQYILNDL